MYNSSEHPDVATHIFPALLHIVQALPDCTAPRQHRLSLKLTLLHYLERSYKRLSISNA